MYGIDIGNYSKENFEAAVRYATAVQHSLETIAGPHGDFARKPPEDTKSLANTHSKVTSLDEALEAQVGYARSAGETFVTELQKIATVYGDLTMQTFNSAKILLAKFTPTSTH